MSRQEQQQWNLCLLKQTSTSLTALVCLVLRAEIRAGPRSHQLAAILPRFLSPLGSSFLTRESHLPPNVFCKKDAPNASPQLSLANDLRLINEVGKTIMAIDKIP